MITSPDKERIIIFLVFLIIANIFMVAQDYSLASEMKAAFAKIHKCVGETQASWIKAMANLEKAKQASGCTIKRQ